MTDRATQAGVIRAYFQDFRRRVEMLSELAANGWHDDALLLATCHIEALGRRLHSYESSKRVFVETLIHEGGNEVLGAVHPQHLLQAFTVLGGATALRICEDFQGPLQELGTTVLPVGDLIRLAREHLDTSECQWLSVNAWRGTIAAIAYERLRGGAVHRGGAVPITFGEATFNGRPLPRLDFDLLYPLLKQVLDKVEEACLRTPALLDPRWAGSD